MTVVKLLRPEGQGGPANWSIGVVKIDWEPGVKWYGGILIDCLPPENCIGYGSYAVTRRAALRAARKELEFAQMARGELGGTR
jgi:hypothetical protein